MVNVNGLVNFSPRMQPNILCIKLLYNSQQTIKIYPIFSYNLLSHVSHYGVLCSQNQRELSQLMASVACSLISLMVHIKLPQCAGNNSCCASTMSAQTAVRGDQGQEASGLNEVMTNLRTPQRVHRYLS